VPNKWCSNPGMASRPRDPLFRRPTVWGTGGRALTVRDVRYCCAADGVKSGVATSRDLPAGQELAYWTNQDTSRSKGETGVCAGGVDERTEGIEWDMARVVRAFGVLGGKTFRRFRVGSGDDIGVEPRPLGSRCRDADRAWSRE